MIRIVLLTAATLAVTAATGASAVAGDDALVQALEQLNRWLGDGENGDRWRAYLLTDEVDRELARGTESDVTALVRALQRFEGDADGLQLPQFVEVRRQLVAKISALRRALAADLPRLASSSRADFVPITPAQFGVLRAELVEKVAQLQRTLGEGSDLAEGWSRFIKLPLLAPHMEVDVRIDRQSLAEIDQVLARLRTNTPGLEHPAFVELAESLQRYWAMAGWAAASALRDTRSDYEQMLLRTELALSRHLDRPTEETIWNLERLIGTVDALGRSPKLVQAVRARFAQPNVSATASGRLARVLAARPVDQTGPVRDVILGTRIFGTAQTLGEAEVRLLPAYDHIELEATMSGRTFAHTNGYNGPVRIRSRSTTVLSAAARVELSDASFRLAPARASATTRSQIRSIRKQGGGVGSRLIERIAWRRAGQQKSAAERIAASHAETRVENDFHRKLTEFVAQARREYLERVRKPLIRRGAFPEHLRLSSTQDAVQLEATFGNRMQLAADSRPPSVDVGADFSVRIHQSAVNNYFALAIAGATISRPAVDRPAGIRGNAPPWLKKLINRPDQNRFEASNSGSPQGEFRPWSITLNDSAPVGVEFDEGALMVRLRAAVLASEESQYEDWDFLVAFQIAVDGNRVLLRRLGSVEVFPTGFDPTWQRRMRPQDSGFRNTLAKKVNSRGADGEGLPLEFAIEPIQLPRVGEPVLLQADSQDGWLTLSWRLP